MFQLKVFFWLVVLTILKNISQREGLSHIFEGSLEVKLPTIWTDEKKSRAEAERRERLEERRVEEKESEERRCRCAKRLESRETLCFSNDLWLRRVEK